MSNITAKIIADSVSAINGKRITTFELEYPRFIHSEFMTHRMISKNAASSRAIPVSAAIQNIRDNTAMPVYWGKNRGGMSAIEESNERVLVYTSNSDGKDVYATREDAWLDAMDSSVEWAKSFADAGYHKQIVNRITEPFQMIKVVATATEWDNFFWLRKHTDAQPEIHLLAEKMWEAREKSIPVKLGKDEWHVPYYGQGYWKEGGYAKHVDGVWIPLDEKRGYTLSEALKISSAMCAQVSYRKADDTLEKALFVYERLVESKPVHASPFEHQASPMSDNNSHVEECYDEGVTGWNRTLGFMSGNLSGWIQHRQIIPDNTCWKYEDAQ